MGKRLTKRLVEQTRPGDKAKVLWDSDIKGFGCKITPTGAKIYFYYYRTDDGQQRRPTIGRHGSITCEKAREVAKNWYAEVVKGGDPSGTRQSAKRASTIAELCDRYLQEHVEVHNKPRTVKQARRIVETKIKPKLGRGKVGGLTRPDVMNFHSSMARTPREANHALAILSKIMSLAEAWGLRSGGSNPCMHVERYRENKRERFLSASELQALGQALANADHASTEAWQVTAAVRLLILTGGRLSEICELAWDQVDFDASVIRMPETKTGSRVIYVTAPVAEVLDGLPRSDDIPWVVPGIKEPSRSLSIATVEHGWRRIKKTAKIPDVRLHDLRHSHASVAASAGFSLPVIGKILGHNTPTTTARYAHLTDDPVRRAAEAIGGTIAAVMKGKKGEVVNLAPTQTAS